MGTCCQTSKQHLQEMRENDFFLYFEFEFQHVLFLLQKWITERSEFFSSFLKVNALGLTNVTFGRIVFVLGGAISILLLLFSICENERDEVKIIKTNKKFFITNSKQIYLNKNYSNYLTKCLLYLYLDNVPNINTITILQ